MSICVAFSNKFMDTRPPQPAGCGDKYDICSAGRSMIEMLGVLAIIGVLSVGGIAGYSKAMEIYKVNKAVSQYGMLIYNMLELHPYSEQKSGLVDILQATQTFPPDWEKVNDMKIKDSYGNILNIYGSGCTMVIDMLLGGIQQTDKGGNISGTFSSSLCMSIFNNLVVPLHGSLIVVRLYRSEYDKSWNNSTNEDTSFYGDNYCGGNNKCITSLKLSTIDSLCNSCSKDKELCAIVLGLEGGK